MDRDGFNLKNLLSKSDAVLLLELIHESLSCKKEEQIKSLIERLEGLLSSERAVSVLAREKANGQIESFTALNINYTLGYVEEYVNGGFTEKIRYFLKTSRIPDSNTGAIHSDSSLPRKNYFILPWTSVLARCPRVVGTPTEQGT